MTTLAPISGYIPMDTYWEALDAPKWLQVGMAKSGNFWLYTILEAMRRTTNWRDRHFVRQQPIHRIAKTWKLSYTNQADIDVLDIEPSGCAYSISSVYKMPIPSLCQYVEQCSHVWSHSPYCNRTGEVLDAFDDVIYIVRDPRDVAISSARFAFTPYGRRHFPSAFTGPEAYLDATLVGRCKQWVRHVGGYLRHARRRTHWVFYENLLNDLPGELATLARRLDLAITTEAIDKIAEQVRFKRMKSANPQHVRCGKAGQWHNQLTAKQNEAVLQIAEPMLRLLGYPLEHDQLGEPSLPTCMSPEVADAAVAAAGATTGRVGFEGQFRRAYIRELWARLGREHDEVSLYGAGQHSDWLLSTVADVDNGPHVRAIFDDFSSQRELAGVPVEPAEPQPNAGSVVIISSDSAEPILAEAARKRFPDALVVEPYREIGVGPFLTSTEPQPKANVS